MRGRVKLDKKNVEKFARNSDEAEGLYIDVPYHNTKKNLKNYKDIYFLTKTINAKFLP